VGGFALSSPSAFAKSSDSANHITAHCDPGDAACGANPALTGPPPPFVTIPSNCPSFISTDSWTLNFVSGNSVFHSTDNKNGSWDGGTAEGQAVFTTSDGTVQYSGHLQEWFGEGQNTPDGSTQIGQGENGFTTNFIGSGIAGNLSIHASGHTTFNNNGTQTANTTNAKVTCS
jgi:hypothetical protein